MDRSVLVTGATGFLGRAVVPRLREAGWRVTALGGTSRSSPSDDAVEFAAGDLADPTAAAELLRPWRWSALVHLAGPVPHGEEDEAAGAETVRRHVSLAANLRAALPQGWTGRLIHASSMTVYGLPRSTPVPEEHPRVPRHLYGLAKMAAEEVMLAGTGLDVWLLRFPGLFSGARRGGALFHFMRAAAAGEPLRVTTPVPTAWEVLHVDDAAEAVVRSLAAQARRPGPVNVGYGVPVELTAMAARVAAMGGAGSPVVGADGVSHPVFSMDVGRARSLLGEWPPASLDERLQALWSEYATDGPLE